MTDPKLEALREALERFRRPSPAPCSRGMMGRWMEREHLLDAVLALPEWDAEPAPQRDAAVAVEPDQAATMQGDPYDHPLVREIVAVVRECDVAFEASGETGSRNWVRDYFIGTLWNAGLDVVRRAPAPLADHTIAVCGGGQCGICYIEVPDSIAPEQRSAMHFAPPADPLLIAEHLDTERLVQVATGLPPRTMLVSPDVFEQIHRHAKDVKLATQPKEEI